MTQNHEFVHGVASRLECSSGHTIGKVKDTVKKEEIHFREVDWRELQNLLLLHAFRLFKAAPMAKEEKVLHGWGASPEDLANNLLLAFIDPSENRVSWDHKRGKPTVHGIVKYLAEVLKNDFLDLKKSPRHKKSQSLSSPSDTGIDDNPMSQHAIADVDVVGDIFKEQVLDLLQEDLHLNPDGDVESYLILQFLDKKEYAAYKPQEVAPKLGWTVSKVNNVKKKFERRLHQLSKKLTLLPSSKIS